MDNHVLLGICVLLLGGALFFPVDVPVAMYPVSTTFVGGSPDNLTVGVSVDDDRFAFGEVPLAADHVKKSFTVRSDRPARIDAHATGNISTFLSFRGVPTTVDQRVNVTILLTPTDTAREGYLSGTVNVVKRVPLYRRLL